MYYFIDIHFTKLIDMQEPNDKQKIIDFLQQTAICVNVQELNTIRAVVVIVALGNNSVDFTYGTDAAINLHIDLVKKRLLQKADKTTTNLYHQ